MTTAWPLWATLRAEEVAQLSPDDRGPWENDHRCQVRDVDTNETHPAGPPYFFHCQRHLDQIRNRRDIVVPQTDRDGGNCIACSKPCPRHPVTMAARVACVQAEQTNSTYARFSTRKYCQRCEERNHTRCRGTDCRNTGTDNRVKEAGCCPLTQSGWRRHCEACCEARRQHFLDKHNLTQAQKAAAAAIVARRKMARERQLKIPALRRRGLTTEQMAAELAVSQATITRDLKKVREGTRAANEVHRARIAERADTIKSMYAQGMDRHQIAERMGLTPKTVATHIIRIRRSQPPAAPPTDVKKMPAKPRPKQTSDPGKFHQGTGKEEPDHPERSLRHLVPRRPA